MSVKYLSINAKFLAYFFGFLSASVSLKLRIVFVQPRIVRVNDRNVESGIFLFQIFILFCRGWHFFVFVRTAAGNPIIIFIRNRIYAFCEIRKYEFFFSFRCNDFIQSVFGLPNYLHRLSVFGIEYCHFSIIFSPKMLHRFSSGMAYSA